MGLQVVLFDEAAAGSGDGEALRRCRGHRWHPMVTSDALEQVLRAAWLTNDMSSFVRPWSTWNPDNSDL